MKLKNNTEYKMKKRLQKTEANAKLYEENYAKSKAKTMCRVS